MDSYLGDVEEESQKSERKRTIITNRT